MTRSFIFVASLCLTLAYSFQPNASAQQEDLKKAVIRSEMATAIIADALSATQPYIPDEVVRKAKAIAVFPDVSRVNLLLEHLTVGYGVLSRRTPHGWSLPAYYAFKGGKVGPHSIGKESPDIILLFMSDEVLQQISKGRIELTGNKKAVGGPLVTSPGPLTEEQKNAAILAYTVSRGQPEGKTYPVMTPLGGYQLYPDNNMNKRVYGLKANEVLALERTTSGNLLNGVDQFQLKLNVLVR